MASATAVTTSTTKRARFSGVAAVDVVAQVDGRVEELVQQVAVGRVHLDAVEPGRDRVAGRGDEVGDQAGDLVGLGRAGYVVGLRRRRR